MATRQHTYTRRQFVGMASAMAATAGAAALSGCGSPAQAEAGVAPTTSPAPAAGALRVGLLTPTSGNGAIYGNAVLSGAQLAADELNSEAANGSTHGIDLRIENDLATSEGALAAYARLRDAGCQVILGPVTSAAAIDVAAQASADGLFLLTPSASSVEVVGGLPGGDGNVLAERRQGCFQLCPTEIDCARLAARFVKERKLGTRVAVDYNYSDTYSYSSYQAFVAEARAQGLEVVSEQPFPGDDNADFAIHVNDNFRKRPDVVFLPITCAPASRLLQQMDDVFGYDHPIYLGGDGLEGIMKFAGFDTRLGEGIYLTGGFDAHATDEKTQRFARVYQERHDDVPNQFAADGYDAVRILASLAERANVTAETSPQDARDALASAITAPDFSFTGLTGTDLTWSEDGTSSREPRMMVIRDDGYVPA